MTVNPEEAFTGSWVSALDVDVIRYPEHYTEADRWAADIAVENEIAHFTRNVEGMPLLSPEEEEQIRRFL